MIANTRWPNYGGSTYQTGPTDFTYGWPAQSADTTYFAVISGNRPDAALEALAELKAAEKRAELMLQQRQETQQFIERRFGYAPGPGRPSPRYARCSGRRLRRRRP